MSYRIAAVVTLGLLAAAPGLGQVPPPAGTTALAAGDFTGSGDAEASPVARGLGDLIVTEAVQMLDAGGPYAGCPAVFVEWRRRKDIEAEIALQQTDAVDPASRQTPGQLIDPTVMITGNTHFEGDTASYVVELRSHPDGSLIRTIRGTVPETEFLDVGGAIAKDVLDKTCARGWKAAGGTVGGGAGVTITGEVGQLEAPFELTGTFQGGEAVFTYTPDSNTGGKVTYALSGSGVTGAGEGTFSMSPQPDGTILIDQTTTGCVDGIPNSCRTTTEQVTLTPQPAAP